MALKYVTDIDLNNNELQNAVVQNLAAAPSTLEAGQIWFNTANHYLYYYNGTASIPLGEIPAGTVAMLETGTDTTNRIWQAKVLHDYIATAIGAADAMRFKGTLGTGGTITALPTSGVQVGDTYRVITAGTYAGQTCEVGDLIIALTTTPTWTVAQTNIEGALTTADASSANPLMDGTATPGTSTKYAREGHVHPTDTSRVPTTRTVNGHALTSDVTVTNTDLGQGYGICATPAATNAKMVVMSGYELTTGGVVAVKFNNNVIANSSTHPTLNINGKADKPIYYNGAPLEDGLISSDNTALFLYDGTAYHLLAVDRNMVTLQSVASDVSNLGTAAFKNITTSITPVTSESQNLVPTAWAVYNLFNGSLRMYEENNPAISVDSSGIGIWTITHNLDERFVISQFYELSTLKQVVLDVEAYNAGTLAAKINATPNTTIAAGTYHVIVAGR